MWRKGNPGALLVRKWTDAANMENSYKVIKKIKKIVLPFYSANPPLCLSEKKKKTRIQKYVCILMFTVALFHFQ